MGTVLPVASRALLTAAERLSLDAEALLRAAGLRRDELDDPDARIPAASADALREAVLRASGDPGFGWRAVGTLRGDEFRVLHHLCAASPTFGDALAGVARWLHLVDRRLELSLDAEAERTTLTLGLRGSATPLPRAPTEFTLGAIVVCTRRSTGIDWAPLRAALTFDAPGDGTDHAALLRCPVAYGASRAQLIVPARLWRAPLEGADPSLRRLLEDYASRVDHEQTARGATGPLDRVREAIGARLGGGGPELHEIARALATSDRSLQRSLQEHGTTFRRLVDDVRFERARAYLGDPGVGIGEVAWMLGFSDPRAFTRAFGRWAGMPPGAWRDAHARPQRGGQPLARDAGP